MFSRGGPISEKLLERATHSLKHRGPESQRCWISPDQRVGLGHARLSIIDLTTGDQPIANEDESLRIVVNGEFYGYEETQKELELDGHKLRTHSDSEIALHLYEKLGTQCLHRLRGEFAFVLWDSVNNTIFAARDRFGIKPLFFAQWDNTLYLASEVKALFAAGVPARWDCESVYNSAGIGEQNRTLFDGVFQIPPGHFMLATENGLQVTRYWDFDYPKEIADAPLALRQGIRGRVHQCFRGGGKASAARRCSCGLLFERRDRFLCCSRIGIATPPRSLARLHHQV